MSRSTISAKIVPHLWYVSEALEAARFYVSLFPDSRVERSTSLPVDSPSGPAGSVQVVEFTLAGQPFQAISAGPMDPFNHSISFMVSCEDQAELDRLWEAFSDGGQVEMCGWVRDRWGLCWQIVPAAFGRMMASDDAAARKRALEAMLQMQKFDIVTLEKAFQGA